MIEKPYSGKLSEIDNLLSLNLIRYIFNNYSSIIITLDLLMNSKDI